jgi:hypothetical protein
MPWPRVPACPDTHRPAATGKVPRLPRVPLPEVPLPGCRSLWCRSLWCRTPVPLPEVPFLFPTVVATGMTAVKG